MSFRSSSEVQNSHTTLEFFCRWRNVVKNRLTACFAKEQQSSKHKTASFAWTLRTEDLKSPKEKKTNQKEYIAALFLSLAQPNRSSFSWSTIGMLHGLLHEEVLQETGLSAGGMSHLSYPLQSDSASIDNPASLFCHFYGHAEGKGSCSKAKS